MMNNQACPYSPKVITPKKAKKEKIGTFYHPTNKTIRTGLCPQGEILREGYTRKGYTKKNGTYVKETVVGQTCIKNKGLPGKLLPEYKTIVIKEKNSFKPYGYSTKDDYEKRHKSLLKAVKDLSYSTVVHKLSALRTFRKNSFDPESIKLYAIFDQDLKGLKEWREKNPNLYKNKSNETKTPQSPKSNETKTPQSPKLNETKTPQSPKLNKNINKKASKNKSNIKGNMNNIKNITNNLMSVANNIV